MINIPLFALTLMLLASAFASATPLLEINWQDDKLKQCVMKAATQQGWKTTQQVTQLKCHKAGIENAQAVAQLTSLNNLSLFSNYITTLDLRPLTQLKQLNIANNRLTTLQIAGLDKLEVLYLFRNKLTTLDTAGLSSLKKVRMMQNKLQMLNITPMKALENGYFFDNELEDLSIEGLSKLRFLDVRQNPMPDELYDFFDEQQGIVISHDGNADDWK